jgi:hypothetical protein
MNKYHAIRTGTSASRKEARRKRELELMQRAGVISDLKCQVPFELIPTQREPDIIGPRGGRKPGKLQEHSCVYVADFVYTQEGRKIVEDAKGFRTPEYIIKRKLMLWVHGIRIKEV